MAENWLQVANEALKIPGLLVEIYGDLARPGVRQVGKALETVVGLGNTILWPINLLNERARSTLEANLERYRKSMESVPNEKVTSVAPEIGVPLAEKLGYVQDENLAAMYVQLLSKASNLDTLSEAHPSFVNVINNLSPDEAHVLKHFVTKRDLPFVHARCLIPGKTSHISIQDLLVSKEMLAAVRFPENMSAYLSNLAGLGLINIRHDAWLDESDHYKDLENYHRPQLEEFVKRTPQLQGKKLDMAKGVAHRTEFGNKFIRACHVK